MDKIVGLLLIVCIATVSGQDYVVTMTKEVQYSEQHQAPSSDPVAGMIHQLDTSNQRKQKLSTRDQNVDFPCLYCEEIMAYVYNATVNQDLLNTVQNVFGKYGCTLWASSVFQDLCHDYVATFPHLIRAFADSYLNPQRCAFFCRPQEINLRMNFLRDLFEKIGRA